MGVASELDSERGSVAETVLAPDSLSLSAFQNFLPPAGRSRVGSGSSSTCDEAMDVVDQREEDVPSPCAAHSPGAASGARRDLSTLAESSRYTLSRGLHSALISQGLCVDCVWIGPCLRTLWSLDRHSESDHSLP